MIRARNVKKENKEKFTTKSRIGELKRNGIIMNIFGFIPMIWSIALVFIVFWGINVSLADPNWYLDNSNTFITNVFSPGNFAEAISKLKMQVSDPNGIIRYANYLEMAWNSLWYSFGGMFMKMVSTVCFAYIMARYNFRGRKFLYIVVVAQMMLPVYGQTSANYMLLSKLGLIDTPLFLLALGAGHGMHFMITYSYFRNLSQEYVDAAKIDGASALQVFGRVMVPLAKPIISALSVMNFIAYWNDYSNCIIYLKSYPTLSGALYNLQSQAFYLGLQTPTYFAGIFISIIPAAALFLAFNKQIMENVSMGGLKG